MSNRGYLTFPTLSNPSFWVVSTALLPSHLIFSVSKTQFTKRRSGGTRGAGMEILRGSKGADFEGRALVTSGGSDASCGGNGGPFSWIAGCFGRRFGFGSEKSENHFEEKHLLVKGMYCFVFYKIEDLAPRYAIALSQVKAVVKDSKPGLTIVALETKHGRDIGYEIGFNDLLHAKRFRDVITEKSKISKSNALHHQSMVRTYLFGLVLNVFECVPLKQNEHN